MVTSDLARVTQEVCGPIAEALGLGEQSWDREAPQSDPQYTANLRPF